MNQELLQKLDEKKRKIKELEPIPKEILEGLDSRFKLELTYNSNAIEGNILTLQETKIVLEKGITVLGKPLKDHIEAKNHKDAFELIKKIAASKKTSEIDENDILSIHKEILKGIDDNNAGIYRKAMVRILGSRAVFPNPLKVPELMEEFVKWLQNEKDLHPAHIAADAHFKLVEIHPFIDGNGRTARLLMNLILIQNGFPPAVILMEERKKYIDSIEKAHLENDFSDFYGIVIESVEKSLDIYAEAIKENIIYE